MASKGKITKSKTELFGRVIDLQCFACDVFVYSALKFGIPEYGIFKWRGVENVYRYPDFILVLSRLFLKFQITQRDVWYKEFKSSYDKNKFVSFDNIRSVMRKVFELSTKHAKNCILHKVIIYLAVINEFILFLYSENRNLYWMTLAGVWYKYVSPMKTDLVEAGGLTELYKTYNKPNYHLVDDFYTKFISENCLSYNEHKGLWRIFHDKSENYFNKFPNLTQQEKKNLENVLRKTRWPETYLEVVSQSKELFGRSWKNSELDYASKIHVLEKFSTGIPPHEDLFRFSDASFTDGARPGSSSQDQAIMSSGPSSQTAREQAMMYVVLNPEQTIMPAMIPCKQ